MNIANKLIQILLIFLLLSQALPVYANPLEAYCISKKGLKAEPKAPLPPEEQPEVKFELNGKPFRVVVEGSNYLSLLDENNTRLNTGLNAKTQMRDWHARQYFGGSIKRLAIIKNNWLWIDGDYTDYLARLDLSKMPPTLGQPEILTNLTNKPCSILEDFIIGCITDSARADYSAVLDRLFVTGHRMTLFGTPDPVTVEIIDGKTKALPPELKGARLVGDSHDFKIRQENRSYYQDFPNLNGVLFQGKDDEAYFYDGITVTPLLTNYLDQEEKTRGWYNVVAPFSKRLFLKNTFQNKPFLVELKAGPMLTPFLIPNELSNDSFLPYEFTQDLQLFGVARQFVVAEVMKGTLRTVVSVETPSFINGGYIQQAPDGTIRLTVHNPKTKADADYFIVRASPSANCITTLNPEKPIVLKNE